MKVRVSAHLVSLGKVEDFLMKTRSSFASSGVNSSAASISLLVRVPSPFTSILMKALCRGFMKSGE